MRIINDILDYSKIEAGKFTIEQIPFDLRMTIEDTLDIPLRPRGDSWNWSGSSMRKRLAPSSAIPAHSADLTNLVGNAIKFTEKVRS